MGERYSSMFRQTVAYVSKGIRRSLKPIILFGFYLMWTILSVTSPPQQSLNNVPASSDLFPISNLSYSANSKGLLRWYLSNASLHYPSPNLTSIPSRNLWPSSIQDHDRIENQLLFKLKKSENRSRMKVILIAGEDQPSYRRPPAGQAAFLRSKCPVNTCKFMYDVSKAKIADLIWFQDAINPYFTEGYVRPAKQIWMMSMLEAPYHTPDYSLMDGVNALNWTARYICIEAFQRLFYKRLSDSYRLDSELVTPYEKYVLYDPAVRAQPQSIDYAKEKTGGQKVAWFVSNCETANNRLGYAKELSKYISVDIYGRCGPNVCERGDFQTCMEMLKTDYKFYLSFENSNCKWYITEKLWKAYLANVIPIVMGAPVEHYELVAPHKSFIHVDQFESPAKLAEYLNYLDKNDTAYNAYFEWKGTGELIDTKFNCRLCALLHADGPQHVYSKFAEWWQGDKVCSSKASVNPIIFDMDF